MLCKNQSVRRHFGLSRFVCNCVVHDISSSLRCRATMDDAIDDAPCSRRLDAGLKMFCEHCGQRCSCPTCHAEVSSCGCSKELLPKYCKQCGANLRAAVVKDTAPVASTSSCQTLAALQAPFAQPPPKIPIAGYPARRQWLKRPPFEEADFEETRSKES